MRFSWLYLPLVLAAASPGLGCSAEDVAPASTDPPGVPGPDATLSFLEDGTLELAPGEERAVAVSVSPPARYEVSFSILGDVPGAWLDRTQITADPDGRAAVVLHAPSLATTFRLGATVKDGPSAELGVSVSDKGFATLRVIPAYGGQRQATEWTASAMAGTTCKELEATLPEIPEGALQESAPADDLAGVEIRSAPVGPNLAVALRAGRAMWGCVDVADLRAGEERAVEVSVKDGPIDLAATALDLTLTFTPNADTGAILAATTARVMDALLPEDGEALALLDAMEAALPPDQQALFAEERDLAGWNPIAATHFGTLPAPLRDACRGWAEADLAARPPEITAGLRGMSEVPGKAWLEVIALGGLPAEEAGVPATAHQASWVSEPGDRLRLDGTVYWIPSRYVGAAAWEGALAAQPGASTMGEALAAAAACDDLAASLGGFGACDEVCLASLCATALDARWSLAVDASAAAGLAGSFALSVSGPAVIDEDATPVAWSAAWLGKISDGEFEATIQGEAEGVESPGGVE